MTKPDEFPHWRGRRRRDGVWVVPMVDRWYVVTPDGNERRTIVGCPCCNKPLLSERAAKLIADAVYLIEGNA